MLDSSAPFEASGVLEYPRFLRKTKTEDVTIQVMSEEEAVDWLSPLPAGSSVLRLDGELRNKAKSRYVFLHLP